MIKSNKKHVIRLIREMTICHLDEVGRSDYYASAAVDAHPRTSYEPTATSWDEYKSGEPAEEHPRADVESFTDMARSMDLSVSGAKQLVDRTIAKARFISNMFPTEEERDAFIIDVVNQYIDYLDTSDELDQEELDLMYDHPELVTELDGFQEFLMDELKDAGFHWKQGMK